MVIVTRFSERTGWTIEWAVTLDPELMDRERDSIEAREMGLAGVGGGGDTEAGVSGSSKSNGFGRVGSLMGS